MKFILLYRKINIIYENFQFSTNLIIEICFSHTFYRHLFILYLLDHNYFYNTIFRTLLYEMIKKPLNNNLFISILMHYILNTFVVLSQLKNLHIVVELYYLSCLLIINSINIHYFI